MAVAAAAAAAAAAYRAHLPLADHMIKGVVLLDVSARGVHDDPVPFVCNLHAGSVCMPLDCLRLAVLERHVKSCRRVRQGSTCVMGLHTLS